MKDRLIDLLSYFGDGYNVDKRLIHATVGEVADYLIENGVVVLPCKVGDTVYVIKPLWYGIWRDDEHKCRKCEHFYEGGMGDPPGCALEDDCCYLIEETEADLRHIADWITPSIFIGKIEWGKTVFLTKEEAEKALAERINHV